MRVCGISVCGLLAVGIEFPWAMQWSPRVAALVQRLQRLKTWHRAAIYVWCVRADLAGRTSSDSYEISLAAVSFSCGSISSILGGLCFVGAALMYGKAFYQERQAAKAVDARKQSEDGQRMLSFAGTRHETPRPTRSCTHAHKVHIRSHSLARPPCLRRLFW
jgi:hypothetical protein